MTQRVKQHTPTRVSVTSHSGTCPSLTDRKRNWLGEAAHLLTSFFFSLHSESDVASLSHDGFSKASECDSIE